MGSELREIIWAVSCAKFDNMQVSAIQDSQLQQLEPDPYLTLDVSATSNGDHHRATAINN